MIIENKYETNEKIVCILILLYNKFFSSPVVFLLNYENFSLVRFRQTE